MIKKLEFKIRSLLNKIIPFKPNFDDPKKYWDFRFKGYVYHHSKQNQLITNDCLNILQKKHPVANRIFCEATTMLEVGCGTGELSLIMAQSYTNIKKIIATDVSEKGIKYAKKKNKFPKKIEYVVFNSLKDNQGFKSFGNFDLSICSNVLEHFSNPYILLNQILEVSKYVAILVPYNHIAEEIERKTDGGDYHIFKFDENSFKDYNVIDSFKFRTLGWSNVTNHNDPQQYFILIKSNLI